MENFDKYLEMGYSMLVGYAPKVLLAVLALIIGWWVIGRITRIFGRVIEKKEVDVSLRNFLTGILGVLLKVLLIISVIGMVGVETSSFVAVLAAAGFAIGLALQGSLGNFAGGVLILILKPFRVDDWIDALGFIGRVDEISIFYTVLKTADNQKVIIPNGQLSNSAVTNITAEPTRRCDLLFGIGYGDDILKARDVIKTLAEADERVLKEPAPQIFVAELGDSSVNLSARLWCNTSDYWGIYFDMHEKVKLEFDRNNISIPFPQRDVHVFNK